MFIIYKLRITRLRGFLAFFFYVLTIGREEYIIGKKKIDRKINKEFIIKNRLKLLLLLNSVYILCILIKFGGYSIRLFLTLICFTKIPYEDWNKILTTTY